MTTSQAHPAAPLDTPTKLVSAAFCVALLGFALTAPVAAESTPAAIILGWIVPGAGIVAAYGFSPGGYALEPDGTLRVSRRLFGGRTFRITEAHRIPELFGLGGIRIAGSGGVFGWYGLFWRKGTGRYRAYVTDRSNLVTCTGPDGLVVISPQDPGAFLASAPEAAAAR